MTPEQKSVEGQQAAVARWRKRDEALAVTSRLGDSLSE
jgi:hypothetical protein